MDINIDEQIREARSVEEGEQYDADTPYIIIVS